MKTITIFTPTYNRAYCLQNLYKSLCDQTNKDFIWLVIDDGSSDNTESLITKFQEKNIIEIQYHSQKNGGKHIAHNRAVELCNTELFTCVDSDDVLTRNAIDVVLNRYAKFQESNILGLYFRRVHTDGSCVATQYPPNSTLVGITDLYHKYKFSGDTMIVLRTQLIKEYRFPVFNGERFVSERVFYNKINHLAPMLLCEDKLYICDYLPDGYTNNTLKLMIENPIGTAADSLSESFFGTMLIYRIKQYAQYNALKKLYSIRNGIFSDMKQPSIIVKFFAFFILPHYIRLFMKMRAKYE